MEEYYAKRLDALNERNRLLRSAASQELGKNYEEYVKNPSMLLRLYDILNDADADAEYVSKCLVEEANKRLAAEREDRQKKATEMPF